MKADSGPALRLYAVESFSTQDGPGIRSVFFLQGCAYRCLYCHNPDSRRFDGGYLQGVAETVRVIQDNRPYLEPNGGGITLSGGEPLHQARPAAALFHRVKELGLSTCLDTAGPLLTADVRELLALTDLVLLDLKHPLPGAHQELTGAPLRPVLDFQDYLDSTGIPYRLRYVLLTGINDTEESIAALKRRTAGRPSLEGVDVLPYHTMAAGKWEAMGEPAPLADQVPTPPERAAALEEALNTTLTGSGSE